LDLGAARGTDGPTACSLETRGQELRTWRQRVGYLTGGPKRDGAANRPAVFVSCGAQSWPSSSCPQDWSAGGDRQADPMLPLGRMIGSVVGPRFRWFLV